MNITRAKLKETLRTIVNEESEYQSFFKKALEKAGKSIPDMSEDEKKAFFNKIDTAWDAKGEKNEALVGGQKELDVDGDGDIGSDDLADLRAGKKADESVNEAGREYPTFGNPLEGFPAEYKELLKKLQRSNNSDEREKLIAKMNVIRKNIKLKPLTNESVVNEGRKRFYQQDRVGSSKYTISFHDGKSTHKDGSDFYGIKTFKNKTDLINFRKELVSKGYKEDSGWKNESVNESTINESPSSEEIRIAMLAVSKQKKYRRVTTSAAVNDLMNSLEVIARDIKNGKIKDESVNESSKDDDYADELQKETEKVLKGKNIKGWKLYVDSRSGTFEFEKKGIDLLIYATPMWDGNPNLPFNVMDGEGDNVNMIEKSIGNLLSFKPQYDLKKDISNYISVLTKTLSKVEQLYNKIKSESVNEAPDGKKRFMFDFYTDSNERNTERETNFLATTLESAIKAAEHICKVTGYAYVEIYYKDLFLGSMKKQNGFKFVEGKGYSKFKSTN